MEKDVAVGQQVNVMMPGMAAFWAGRLVLPEDFALGVANRDEVLPVGGSDENQSFCLEPSCGTEGE
jgi:hypothetical protein